MEKIIQQNREAILRIASAHGGHNVRIFGSAARGECTPESDIDLLVELEDDRSLFDQSAMTIELEALLGRKVDVVEPEGLHWYIRENVLQSATAL